ncbi:helix-turn-helix domain-containing protein [Epilithonimonas pallida]|uniref:Tetratricopeptide repeat-containing protein n=2 Tax=Bacteria TaxID=2 RepID=A0ABY1R5X6_9FLAO|nr:helix-turn-helix domain-containing protein [Epilithonimonas pallida]SMP94178.1 Tetratricopeptide repeat-containing protein [Epilithonimonas pallida]
MKNLLILFFLMFASYTFGQSADNLSDEYEKLKKESSSSPEVVIKEGRFLKKKAIYAGDLKLASKISYSIGFAFFHTGNSDSCIHYSNSAIEFADKIDYKEGKALGWRMLGTEYAKIGLVEKAKTAFNKAIGFVEGQENDEAYSIKGKVYSSMLLLYNPDKEQSERVKTAQRAASAYNKISDVSSRRELLPTAYTNLSYEYAATKQFDSAHYYLNKALELADMSQPVHMIFIYHQKGVLFSEEGKHTEAIINYKKALSYCKNNEFFDKKMEILGRISESYTQLGDSKNALYYTQLYQDMYREKSQNGKVVVSKIENAVSKENTMLVKKNWILICICVILSVFIVAVIVWRKKKVKAKKMETQDININKETENHILNKLAEFEAEKKFLDKEISLYVLSNQFQCNSKYLSVVIKNHKSKSFTRYLNDLRIEFLVDELNNTRHFKNYKINHLADMVGFASYNAFIKAFHVYTNEKPSDYINKLKTKGD